MRDRLYTSEAVVIRRTEVGEADRLLTIYTPYLGKYTIAARGVRKTTSKLAGHLELFVYTRLQLAKGRSVDVVTESRVIDHYRHLREDLGRISWAYYVAELLDKMTVESSENTGLFKLLIETLAGLDASDEPLRQETLVRRYELHVLTLSGYRPHVFHCALCQAELGQDARRFSVVHGGVLCPRCGESTPAALDLSLQAFKLLRYLMRASVADTLALSVSAGLLAEAGSILRPSIRLILERDLKSVAFLDRLRS